MAGKSADTKLKEMANGKDLANKMRSAGYGISSPKEVDDMLCYPKEETAEAAQMRMSTCPPDPRFQQQNVTKWCYRMYIDYRRCAHLLSPESEYCDYFYKCYHSLCPNAWHTKWDEQVENGTFPRDITVDMQPKLPKHCDPEPYPVPKPIKKEKTEE